MARYIVIRVERNETADELLKRFESVPAIETIGLFASGTKFCPGKDVCGADRKLLRSEKWGTTHCSVCRLPVTSISQRPRNLLVEPDIHPRYQDVGLSVLEPYTPPTEKYGEQIVEQGRANSAAGREKLRKHKMKKRREDRKRANE